MTDLKKEVEAILFAAGRPMHIAEILRLCSVKNEEKITTALNELKTDYEKRDTSLNILKQGENYKLMIKDKYIDSVREINPHTELSKTVMETLAVIAWKTPAKQSDIIKVRTNKAYDHIKTLEEMAFITKEKHGRTYLIRLTKNFFEYFDLPNEAAVKEKFAHLQEEHPAELDDINVKHLQVIDLKDSDGEHIGDLEVVDVQKPPKLKVYEDGDEQTEKVKLDVVDINKETQYTKTEQDKKHEDDDDIDLDDVADLLK